MQTNSAVKKFHSASLKAEGHVAANDEVFEHIDAYLNESTSDEFGFNLEHDFQFHKDPSQSFAESRLHDRELSRPSERPTAKDRINTHQGREARKSRYLNHNSS